MNNSKKTLTSCYIAFIALAVMINLAPLLFVTFEDSLGVTRDRLTLLITLSFISQLVADILSLKITALLGLRRTAVSSQLITASGLVLLSFLPNIINPFAGLVISVSVYSFGIGLLEAVTNPICDMIPKSGKSIGLVLLHSFYCWGYVAVVLLTTAMIRLFDGNWQIIPIVWAVIPLVNAFRFARDDFAEPEHRTTFSDVKRLLSNRSFVLCLIMIVFGCSAEQAMSQWAPYFAKTGLNFSENAGNLLGPCLFAVMMGLCRILFSVFGKKLRVKSTLIASCIGCVICYLVTALSPVPMISLIACALTGFTIALMCPNVLNLAANNFGSSTESFILLLACADIGCALGPTVLGRLSSFLEKLSVVATVAEKTGFTANQVAMRGGILISTLFPVILLALVLVFRDKNKERT